MWSINNDTPFAVGRCFVRDRDGAELWLVAIKATFAVTPDGSVSLAETQEPVFPAPVQCDPAGQAGLRYESDLMPAKPTTDILLHATAHAPNGERARSVTVKARVGPIAKTLQVVGDRRWEPGLFTPRLSPSEPFFKMALTWQRAYGGKDPRHGACDPRNPVGRGFALRSTDLVGTLAPNIAYPGIEARPACFAPVSREWSPRAALAGTYDQTWHDKRKPLLPDDFDDRFWQAAPGDQQSLRHLIGGEEVELSNLTPSGYWRFELPRIALNCTTRFGRKLVHHRPDLRSVTIEPDAGRVMMAWGTSVPCHHRLYELSGSQVTVKRQVGRGA